MRTARPSLVRQAGACSAKSLEEQYSNEQAVWRVTCNHLSKLGKEKEAAHLGEMRLLRTDTFQLVGPDEAGLGDHIRDSLKASA